MDTIYIILCRYSPDWDGTNIYRTKSKSLFDFINMYNEQRIRGNNNTTPYFCTFSDELRTELRAAYAAQLVEYPQYSHEPLDEDMTIGDAMEWLEVYGGEYNTFPVILAGTAELTFRWNW